MRILIATDAWHPQVNGVVRTLTSLARAAERLGVTILLVTHDPVFAAMAKRVLRLIDGALEQAMAFDEDDEALVMDERGLTR